MEHKNSTIESILNEIKSLNSKIDKMAEKKENVKPMQNRNLPKRNVPAQLEEFFKYYCSYGCTGKNGHTRRNFP